MSSSSNFKSLLQEYCAKRSWSLPVYDSVAEVNSSGGITWNSTCIISTDPKGTGKFTKNTFSASGVNKMEGQQKSAGMAYEFITKAKVVGTPKRDTKVDMKKVPIVKKRLTFEAESSDSDDSQNSEIETIDSDSFEEKKKVIIIDLENLPNLPLEISEIVSKGRLDMFTISSKHGSTKVPSLPNTKHIYTPSMAKNAADMCIALFIGRLLAEEKYDEYFIGTRDKFILPIVDCVSMGTTPQAWSPKPMHIITQKEHLEELL